MLTETKKEFKETIIDKLKKKEKVKKKKTATNVLKERSSNMVCVTYSVVRGNVSEDDGRL